MNEFGFWQRWGLELDDKQFANAFFALGVLAASQFEQDNNSYTKDLPQLLSSALKFAQRKSGPLSWRFPQRNHLVNINDAKVYLSSMNPIEVAKVWKGLAGEAIHPLRIQVLSNYPMTEEVRPWFRVLFETDLSLIAAHIVLDTPLASPHLKWPLRLGYLPGDPAEESVRTACSKWPSHELAMDVQISRENANSDILLFTGSSRQLLKTLLGSAIPIKTNLFIVGGTFEDDLSAMGPRLSAIAAESRASGLVFLNPSVKDDHLGNAVNRFIENLSHNQSIDTAVSEAFVRCNPMDPVIFINKEFASFRIERFMETLHSRLIGLPKKACLSINRNSFNRMNIPVNDLAADEIEIPENVAKKLKEYKNSVKYEHESTGAQGMAEISKAVDCAECLVSDDMRQQRFLQEQVFIKKEGKYIEEHRAFRKGVPTLLRVRIGPPDEKWESVEAEFPDEKLPKDRDEWRLTVVLTEPNHLKEPLRRTIKLTKSGPSTDCEFRIQPGEHSIFEGRITVLHRGRVLQTGVLRCRVVVNEYEISNKDKISFADVLHVRSRIDDIERRRQFDLAFVMNHTIDQRPLLTAIAPNHAWLADLSAYQDITKDINYELTKMADLVKDYSGGLISDENVKMLIKLANIGRQLYGKIVLGQIKQPGNQASFEGMEYIQIVSTKSEALMPLEFIYSAVAPDDNAKLCPNMAAVVKETDKNTRMSNAKALIERTCQAVDKGKTQCKYRTEEYVCPMGFWATSKVIERHTATPLLSQPGKDFFLQSEPTTSRTKLDLSGTAIVAASEKVEPEMLLPVLMACADRLGSPPQEAKDWSDWVELIKTFKPHILVALPHTNGSGKDATLEINGKNLSSGQITENHVHAADDKTYPLVALLGCDTAGTALDYGDYVSWFRWQGAAIVISTIAKVFGGHATAVAEALIKGLKQTTDQPECIGEVIRDIKRQALLDGSLMALCIVPFGDADWKL